MPFVSLITPPWSLWFTRSLLILLLGTDSFVSEHTNVHTCTPPQLSDQCLFAYRSANYVLSTACQISRISDLITLKRWTLMEFILRWLPPATIHLYLQTCQRRARQASGRIWAWSHRLINTPALSLRNLHCDAHDTKAQQPPITTFLPPEPFLREAPYYLCLFGGGRGVDSILFLQYVWSTENTFNYKVWKMY